MRNQLLNVDLDTRRQQLGMSCAAVAQRSGVSLVTVQRMMRGDYRRAVYDNVAKVAQAVGMGIELNPLGDAETYRERQARQKAERLVRIAQGSSALEAQAVRAQDVRKMIQTITYELLGSKRKLWSA